MNKDVNLAHGKQRSCYDVAINDCPQLFETRYLRHDLADFLDLAEAIIFHKFFFGH